MTAGAAPNEQHEERESRERHVRRIVFVGGGTGGHLYPGLAIARAVVRARPSIRPFFVGALRGIERDVLPTTEFAHALLDLHPLYRQRVWRNWRTAASALGAWRRYAALVAGDPPALVVATGGYASGLALAHAALHGVPFVLQEANSHPGLTTRLFARRAREVYLGFPEAARALGGPRATLVDVGNPIEPPPSPRPSRDAARREWNLPVDGRVLLVYGGSQGARAINDAVAAWVRSGGVPNDLHLLWQTGKSSYEQYASLDAPRVRVIPYIAPMARAYAAADLALARAGAMSTAELCAWGIPAVLVPLPTAAEDHQMVNARALAAADAAVLLPQHELSAERLDATVRAIVDAPAELARLAGGARRRARPDAAAEIARRILALVDATRA